MLDFETADCRPKASYSSNAQDQQIAPGQSVRQFHLTHHSRTRATQPWPDRLGDRPSHAWTAAPRRFLTERLLEALINDISRLT